MELPLLFLIAIAWIGVWLLSVNWDKKRIERYFAGRGCEVVETTWRPFARWWSGDRNETHYQVWYRDRDGTTWECLCKTSMFTGVFTTEEQVHFRPQPPSGMKQKVLKSPPVDLNDEGVPGQWDAAKTPAELRLDNESLRAEIRRLRGE